MSSTKSDPVLEPETVSNSVRGATRALLRFHWVVPAGRLFKKTVRSTYDHHCADASAAMAFDFIFAIFPGIVILAALLALMDIPIESFGELTSDLGIVVPHPVAAVVAENILHVWETSQSLFFIGIIGVLWPASASMSTTMNALNRAYATIEQRTFWQRRVLSIVLVISMGLALIFLFNLIAFSEQVEAWLSANWAISNQMPSLAGIVRRAAVVCGTLAVAATIYRVAPDVKLGWLDVAPGSVLFLALWSIIAGGFGYFVANFGYYNVIHGLLYGVIVLLLSAYLVAFTLLLGGELNGNLYRMRRSG